jgi:hypothetical protein
VRETRKKFVFLLFERDFFIGIEVKKGPEITEKRFEIFRIYEIYERKGTRKKRKFPAIVENLCTKNQLKLKVKMNYVGKGSFAV